jgi:TPR repeat protein
MRHVMLFSLALIAASPCFGQSPNPFQSVPAPSVPAPVAKPRPARPPASEPDTAQPAPAPAAAQVSVEEATKRAQEASNRKDYAEEARWWRVAADQGDAEGEMALGELYLRGMGVTQDYAEALRWSQKSAAQGNGGAMVHLAFLYSQGYGVPKDYAQAVLWYRRMIPGSGNRGVFFYKIAEMYEEGGPNLPQDAAQARYWYQLAAQDGWQPAKDWLAKH